MAAAGGSGIAQRRMRNQRLWGTAFGTGRRGGRLARRHAGSGVPRGQVVGGATDAAASTDAAVDQAFADGTILRTHILRPTWHFVSPGDLRWLLALSAPRVHALERARTTEDPSSTTRSSPPARRCSLERWKTRHLTRAEVAVELDHAGVTASGLRLAYILMHAELEAVICSGAPRGKQQTYASFDERVPAALPRDRDEALAELTARYFTSRGPATVKDFARWCSFTLGDARDGLEMVQSQLEHEVVDGRTYWFAASPERAAPTSPVVDLVQGYDECIMSYSESKDILREPAAPGDRTVPSTTRCCSTAT